MGELVLGDFQLGVSGVIMVKGESLSQMVETDAEVLHNLHLQIPFSDQRQAELINLVILRVKINSHFCLNA